MMLKGYFSIFGVEILQRKTLTIVLTLECSVWQCKAHPRNVNHQRKVWRWFVMDGSNRDI